MTNKHKIIVRFPPSPTGYFHIGGARTALFNFLFAKQTGGKMLMRFEDTDKERSKKEFEEDIKASLEWLGIQTDDTPMHQSRRSDIYKKYLRQIIDRGLAYVSQEDSAEGKRSEVIRFKNPNRKIKFNDLIRGEIEFDTSDLKDFVIAKSLDEPLYHLAVVVDDFETGVTHVIRGEDHISNTPRQILIQEAIGAPQPIYAHIPLILAPDRSKLSKRHGAVSVLEYRNKGYLPDALVNYLALLGWNPGTDQEMFSRDELIKHFNLERIQKGGAIFDVEKLNWMNKQYLLKMPRSEQQKLLLSAIDGVVQLQQLTLEQKTHLAPVLLDRIHYTGEVKELVESGEFDYLYLKPKFSKEKLIWKQSTLETAKKHLLAANNVIKEADINNAENVKEALMPYAEKEGKGEVLWPLRMSLSGKDRSIDPFNLISILGKDESLSRIDYALTLIK